MKSNTYFISDLHLGAPSAAESRARERRLVQFLDSISKDAKTLYIVGDLFDFWFEYKQVVPRGHSRFLGRLALLVDQGLELHIFTGNHDLWMHDYLEEELGATVHHKPMELELDGKRFYLAHGDGLGPGDLKYKFLKVIFTNPLCKWLYNRLHPNFGVGFAARMSRMSRHSQSDDDHSFLGENERMWLHSKSVLSDQWFDYFVYGHRHHLKNLVLAERTDNGTKLESRYVVLGDWITLDTYARWDGTQFSTHTFTSEQ